jgi:hypothetical protein
MTVPTQSRQRSKDGPRTYPWPPQPPHEMENLSVTSAIKSLNKPFLVGWAAKMSAECAVEDHALIGEMLKKKTGKKAALDYVKQARFRDSEGKADRGTIVHAAIEAYIAGKPVDIDAVQEALEEKFVPPGLWKATYGMIDGVMEFLFDYEPEIIWSEATVYSRTHEYAGTADLIARVRIGDSILPAILDIKTGKAIYNETAMQLTAYARADFVGLDDGKEKPLLPKKYGQIKHGIAIRPTASGKYEPVNFDLTDEVFDKFLACLELADVDSVLARARRA